MTLPFSISGMTEPNAQKGSMVHKSEGLAFIPGKVHHPEARSCRKAMPTQSGFRADADTSGKKYADQKAYSELDDKVFSGYWTLQPGAIIVQGLVDLETATETELRQSYPEVIFVRNFTDNRSRGSSSMRHWRVGGE